MEIIGVPQKDPNTSRLYVMIKMDSLEALYFRDAMKRMFENPQGAGEPAHMGRMEDYKNFAKKVWTITNPD